MQNSVLERGLYAFPVNPFREGKGSLVVAIRVFAINPLITGMVIGRASSADRQHPSLKSDINPIESDTRHLGEHDYIIAGFLDVGWRQKCRPRGRSLTLFDG